MLLCAAVAVGETTLLTATSLMGLESLSCWKTVQASSLINACLVHWKALLFSPRFLKEAKSVFCLLLSGWWKRNTLPQFVRPPASIHLRWIEHEGFSQAQERPFSWGCFRRQTVFYDRVISLSGHHLYNVTCEMETVTPVWPPVGYETCLPVSHNLHLKKKILIVWLNSASFYAALIKSRLCKLMLLLQ